LLCPAKELGSGAVRQQQATTGTMIVITPDITPDITPNITKSRRPYLAHEDAAMCCDQQKSHQQVRDQRPQAYAVACE
jgi:hypothetical protein